MKPDLTQRFKNLLLAQRASVLTQLRDLRGGAVGRAQASAEHFGQTEDSTAQVSTARDIEFALDDHESAELNHIEAALQRIGMGTYGQCLDCGTPISVARLLAAPEATRCLPCQKKIEAPMRHGAGV